MSITLPATDSALQAATDFVEGELEKAECSMRASMQITVALEELFVNVAHYAYPDKDGDVLLVVSIEDDIACISLEDSGVPFNPLTKDDPDVTLDIAERDIGGLGIFMVKKTMDSFDYSYENGKNIVTFTKRIK